MIILQIGSIFGAIKEAWHFVGSAVKSAIGSEEAQRLITPISDLLKPQDVDLYYGLYSEAVEAWQKITNIPDEYLVNKEFAILSPFDWRQEHIVKMRIHGIDTITGELVDTWITVESNKELTKGEWLQLGQEAVFDSPFGYSYEIEYASEFEYYIKDNQ